MRIVSLNAWGGAVFGPLVEWLPRCGADVICLQEVTRTHDWAAGPTLLTVNGRCLSGPTSSTT